MKFSGLDTASIENEQIQIEYIKNGALRLARLFLRGHAESPLVELPDEGWHTALGYYHLLGGHRFWTAPESLARTYIPEPFELEISPLPDGVRLVQPVEVPTGFQKILEIHLQAGAPAFTLTHILVNCGQGQVEVAPWAISQFKLGGIAALPQSTQAVDADGLLPNRALTLWPYTHLNDHRLRFLEGYLMLCADQEYPPFKVGFLNRPAWGAYLWNEMLITKQTRLQPGAAYPDMNSNFEIYANHRFLELETTGPLVTLQPGQQTVHEETWHIQAVPGLRTEMDLKHYLDARYPQGE